MYQDKTLICKDCGNEFVFTAGEQEFYAEKDFENEPVRCKDCRVSRKASIREKRELHVAVVQNVAEKQRFHSFQRMTVRFTAANVSAKKVLNN